MELEYDALPPLNEKKSGGASVASIMFCVCNKVVHDSQFRPDVLVTTSGPDVLMYILDQHFDVYFGPHVCSTKQQ